MMRKSDSDMLKVLYNQLVELKELVLAGNQQQVPQPTLNGSELVKHLNKSEKVVDAKEESKPADLQSNEKKVEGVIEPVKDSAKTETPKEVKGKAEDITMDKIKKDDKGAKK